MNTKPAQIILLYFVFLSSLMAADADSTQTLLKYFQACEYTGDALHVKMKQTGERWLRRSGGEQDKVLAYGEEVTIKLGSVVSLSSKHAKLKIEFVILDASKVVLVTESQDQRSQGKDLLVSYSGSFKAADKDNLTSMSSVAAKSLIDILEVVRAK